MHSIGVWKMISRRRRSTWSASTLAGKQNRKAGSVVAVWISATISGDRVRLVISQAAATFCIQTLMLAARMQIQIVR